MDDSTRRYLEAQVMTATPQKLRLMLIEGALRFAHETLHHWEHQRNEHALESLIRCRSIISELLSGIQPKKDELTGRVASVYLFLFRNLIEAQLKRDRKKLQDSIRVLEVEQETWSMVCEKLPYAPVPTAVDNSHSAPREIIAPLEGIDGPQTSSFSFDA